MIDIQIISQDCYLVLSIKIHTIIMDIMCQYRQNAPLILHKAIFLRLWFDGFYVNFMLIFLTFMLKEK